MDEILKNPARVAIGSTTQTIDAVRLLAYEAEQTQKADLLLRLIQDDPGPALVFVGTKRKSESVAKKLTKAGIQVALLHGDRSQPQRVRALEQFQQGKVQVLVATDVASRGIHVDSIAQVINYDMPKMAEDFIHRAGRTGRAGESGKAITFFTALERREIGQLERAINRKIERVLMDGKALAHEERVGPVDTSKLRLVSVASRQGGNSSGPGEVKSRRRRYGRKLNAREDRGAQSNSPRMMLEGEVLQKFN
jgi:ATP-dependent RNA helicase RhlE